MKSDTQKFWDREALMPTKLPSVCMDHKVQFGMGLRRFLREKASLLLEKPLKTRGFLSRNDRDYLDS